MNSILRLWRVADKSHIQGQEDLDKSRRLPFEASSSKCGR